MISSGCTLLLFIGSSCAVPSADYAHIRHVPQQYPTIQACIEAAADYDECLVSAGTYHEAINFLGKPITVRSVAGPQTTIIDATGLGESAVKCINHEGHDTTLEGFTVTGGTGTEFAGNISGGGMLNWDSTPTVIRCHFRNNTAETGGGVLNYFTTVPTFVECAFEGNTAHFGAGMCNVGADPVLIACSFGFNRATDGSGGGIANALSSDPVLSACTLSENEADLGGGMYSNLESHPLVYDSRFQGNTAWKGGAVYSLGDSYSHLTRVEFIGNTAAVDGGGIYYEELGGRLIDCTFVENRAARGGAHFSSSFFTQASLVAGNLYRGNTAERGGAIYTELYGRLELDDCRFEENEAKFGGSAYMEDSIEVAASRCAFVGNHAEEGGAIYSESATPELNDCTLEANRATRWGGALYILHGYPSDSWNKARITDTAFRANEAQLGGAIQVENGYLRISRCRFEENKATEGGAIQLYGQNNEIANCEFDRNIATVYGGAIADYSHRGTLLSKCLFRQNSASEGGALADFAYEPATITECHFEGNVAVGAGAMLLVESAPMVINCTFYANLASGEYGGGGAIFNLSDGSPIIRNSLLVGNVAAYGSAIFNLESGMTIEHCTFASNKTWRGGCLEDHFSSVRVFNSIFAGDVPQIVSQEESTTTLIFCNVPTGLPAEVQDGGGNLSVDPMFVRLPSPVPDGQWDGINDDPGDLRLQADSLCIDGGDPTFVPQPGVTDRDGHGRVLCGRTDMGAYEFGIGDYNCDGVLAPSDLAAWQDCMTGPTITGMALGCEAVNFNGDAVIDLLDYAALQRTGTH